MILKSGTNLTLAIDGDFLKLLFDLFIDYNKSYGAWIKNMEQVENFNK